MRALIVLVLTAVISPPAAADEAEIGKLFFFSPSLSVTGTQSCASCHDPANGFAGLEVTAGAVPGRIGNRKPPSLAYQGDAPAFHHMTEEGDVTFVGGDFLDGRARGDETGQALADQAKGPFLNPLEMAMPDSACVVLRACELEGGLTGESCDAVQNADIDADCLAPEGQVVLDDSTRAATDQGMMAIMRALAAYERGSEVQPFSSRFDAYLRGTNDLTQQEKAGLALFSGKAKCAQCHVISDGSMGQPPLFTDFTYDNLGVPRNPDNPWYSQPENTAGMAWIDEGLAVTLRADPVYADYAEDRIGAFKVPTLRNLTKGTGRSYMHNGWFRTLAGVVHFYNTRDVLPACAGEVSEAEALAQNCWPKAEVAATMNRDELGKLNLTADEETALVDFLDSLDDR